MTHGLSFDELVKKVQQQEDTIVQLLKIIAATNNRISEIQVKQKYLEQIKLDSIKK